MRVKTPSMHDLMDDPLFRAYMKRIPSMPRNLATGQPWQLWLRVNDSWRTGRFDSYRDAWPVFLKHFREPDRDVTLTSRRVFYAPPGEWYKVKVRTARNPTPVNPSKFTIKIEDRWRQTFFWDVGLEWCGRCRRPVYWQPLHKGHHAVRTQPAFTTEDNLRCTICGIRSIAMPDIRQMNKMERIDAS